MSTKPQQSRQERALAQRTDEGRVWGEGGVATDILQGRCRNYNGREDKVTKASRDVTALKAKLGRVTA